MNERGNVTVLMRSRFLFWRESCLLIFVFAKQITPPSLQHVQFTWFAVGLQFGNILTKISQKNTLVFWYGSRAYTRQNSWLAGGEFVSDEWDVTGKNAQHHFWHFQTRETCPSIILMYLAYQSGYTNNMVKINLSEISFFFPQVTTGSTHLHNFWT